MITIKFDSPRKLRGLPLHKVSAYVSFPYDPQIVEYIKGFSTRAYIPEEKVWEVQPNVVSKICNRFPEQDVAITGVLYEKAPAPVQLPENFAFKTTPYSHQIEGVVYGLEKERFILGDEQGLGKTKQFIDLAVALKQQGLIKHCLVICGVNGNKKNWEQEVAIHSNEKCWILGTRFMKRKRKSFIGTAQDRMDDLNNIPDDVLFLITNVETLRLLSYTKKEGNKEKRFFPMAEKINELCQKKILGLVGFDECQKAKDPNSQQGAALLGIYPRRAVAMSGTPLMNNPLDLFVPLKWLGHETHNFYQYKGHYCVFGGYNNADIVGYKNLDELRALLDTVMLRRRKSDVLDLPEKVYSTEFVEMYPDQAKVYKEVQSSLKNEIDKIKISPNPLAQLIRLRQATGYPGILSTKVTKSAKMDRMVELVDEAVENGNKCVIFSNWTNMTEVARKYLKHHNVAYITGEVPTDERMDEVNRFQKDPKCKVIIGTIGAMGTGLTLNAANTVIFLDSPWNRALKDQAEDRAHRIGTTGTVSVITIVCEDTFDEIVEEIVDKKGRMADLLVDGKMAVVDQMDYVRRALGD